MCEKSTKGYDNIPSSSYADIMTNYDNCTNIENEDINNIFKHLFLSIPSSVLIFSLIKLLIKTLKKPLFNYN